MSLDNVLLTLKNVQIYPSTIRVECNDKVTKSVFSRTVEQYQNMMNNALPAGVIEKKNHKKKSNLITSYTFQNFNGYGNQIPLDEFDRAVLSVCISEFLTGNQYTTPAIIFRALIGKVGSIGVDPTEKQAKMIEEAIDKLMFTQFCTDAAKAIEELKYSDGDELILEKSAILPCYRVKAVIGGHTVKAIFFDRESPHWIIADKKNQVLRYDSNLLYTGDHHNSRHKIAVTNYVLRRAMEIVYHKNLTPRITFKDVFSKCRVDTASRKIISALRENILEIFHNLKNADIISDFSAIKNGVNHLGIEVDRKS